MQFKKKKKPQGTQIYKLPERTNCKGGHNHDTTKSRRKLRQ